jgi:type IV pilus assembly protein PilA
MTKPVKIAIIVAAIIPVGLTCILILMTLAIPAMQTVTRRAHQTSAIASLRILNSMEAEYNATYPDHGFACSLTALGGEPGSVAPTADAAQLIPSDLASGTKAGYVFEIGRCKKVTVGNKEKVTAYRIAAVPISPGHSGDIGYCTDESGQILYDPNGDMACTELLK